ncbi:5'-nucleotidase [Streptomyces spororaveus]|uniref:5'-nucleotidase n=1 Tax=Streptomyces spororaveus TaxID=284039 RepID=A0ABQ3TMS8_9ACTN|nr:MULTISPECIES: 5'-nucleotidase [Streptomyces]MCX5307542.1 5'-nucleotidase [Streptomyces sp. NBC_00160]GHI81658.1 5'-nucleotidase [Streptomyces spororaveus]
MKYDLSDRVVIGIASSALFDLADCDAVFREQGEDAYRRYQEAHVDDVLDKGVAFPFVRRLLSLNDLAEPLDPLVEVIILSRNDPDTGLRVMRSIAAHGLQISRAVFRQGRSSHRFIRALNMSLFLSASGSDVREAVADGLPAGHVLATERVDDDTDQELRIAFDFDGVLAGDSSERIFRTAGIDGFRAHEVLNAATPHDPGPLKDFLAGINRIQRREEEERRKDPAYQPRLRVSLVTARDAPAHERAVRSLKQWGLRVNDAFFLGGIDKAAVMSALDPHIFFDDQVAHLTGTAPATPSVHVPFGVVNAPHPGPE